MTTLALLLQSDAESALGVAFGGMFLLLSMFCLAITVLVIAGLWKVFTKAGHPGWAALVPIYNAIVLLQIAGRPTWWVLLFFIPFVGAVVWFVVAIDIARSFGQGTAFGLVLLGLLGAIGFLMLGFGSYRYVGPAATRGV